MPATPIQRLACALKALGYVERRRLPARAGVDSSAVQRAYSEQPIKPSAYIKLCGALGISVATGEAAPVRILGEINWRALALGFEITRQMRKLTLRQIVTTIGTSKASLSRLENGKAISINGVIAVCGFIGTSPEHYCQPPELLHVKQRTSETNGVAA
jgi:DNA-binding Xre family transcriptional regulator